MTFAENIKSLPSIDHLRSMELVNEEGELIASIENKPGKSGSLSIYSFLISKYGQINSVSANEGLALFSEHIDAARAHRGSHPNIDLLFDVLALKMVLHGITHAK